MSDYPRKHQTIPDTHFLQEINLDEAIHLICHAGYPDPRECVSSENTTQLLQRVIDDLCTLSMHDGLTGLSNLRYFQIALKRETHRAARDGTPCSLLMIDMDHFKLVNDTYGHPVGDQALIFVAKLLKKGIRPGDTLARYGGEEFAVILPNCSLQYAIQVAERLRHATEQASIPIAGKQPLSFTISIGVAEIRDTPKPDLKRLVKTADEALYEAKSLGRNRIAYEAPITTKISSEEKKGLFKHKHRKKGK